MKTRTSWREKMNTPELPKLAPIPPNMHKCGPGVMLVPSPQEIEAAIREIPKGGVLTLTSLREYLARKHNAAVTCPLTAGLFVRIVAEAAEESGRAGESNIAPYWRVVKDDGSLNPKFPGGVERQAERLREEGHRIEPGSGKKPPRVADISAAGGRYN
jgi:alkylated DNA nucleotide flippase Atl1